MPRIHATLSAMGLTLITLTTLAPLSEAQVPRSIRKPAPSTVKTPAEEPAPAPAPAPPPKAEEEENAGSGESRRRERQTPTETITAALSRMSVTELLEIPQIQQELKLTERQKAQLKTVGDAGNQMRRQYMVQMGGNGRDSDSRAMEEAMAGLQQESAAATAGILTPTQRTRLQQILLQARGILDINAEDTAAQLRLYPKQRMDIQEILQKLQMGQAQVNESSSTRLREALTKANDGEGEAKSEGETRRGGRGGRGMEDPKAQQVMEEAGAQAQKLREQAIQAISRVLTTSQKTAYNRLIGAPFTFEGINVGRGGGGAGGGRGAGGPGGGRGAGGPGGGRGGRP